MGDPVGVPLLTFAALLLQLGMLRQIVEAIQLGLIVLRVERLAVAGDQARHIAVFGLDDDLESIVAFVHFVQQIAHGRMVLGRVEPMLNGAPDQRPCVQTREQGPVPAAGRRTKMAIIRTGRLREASQYFEARGGD